MSEPFVLTEERWSTLVAATQRILPSGDGPGAAEANVVGYIEWVTQQDFFRPKRQRLVNGIDLLRDLARATYGKELADCNPLEQDEVLTKLQSIPHPIVQRFLLALVKMTLAGFLSDPSHGGNHDRMGWRYIGFEPVIPEPIPEQSTEGGS
jgi:gluconate 2-dehydrogenase gamma chain